MIDTPTPARSGTALAWIVYAFHFLVSGVLALFAITSVFMTDSCGSVADEPAVCNSSYFGAVLIGYWVALAALLVAVPILIVRAGARGRSAGLRASTGLALAVVLTVVFISLMVR